MHEDPHFADAFAPGDTVWAFASYSDHRNGEITRFSVSTPDGDVFMSWDFDLASEDLPKPFYSGTAWDWPIALPADAPEGEWSLAADFEGETYRHAFRVVAGTDMHRGHSRHAHPPGR